MNNPFLDTDSYKYSHPAQYPPGMTSSFSHFIARGGVWNTCTLFGLQGLLLKYFTPEQCGFWSEEADHFCQAHGEPVVEGFDGIERLKYWPVRIRALPEGTIVPIQTPVFTVESTDKRFPWVTQFLETQLARLWYPSTVALQSREMRKIIYRFLQETSDNPDAELPFKLHDFGGRGVTCYEQAQIGGAAHLASGAMGSDTTAGIAWANRYYNCEMSAFSIPATEHSTVLSWHKNGEYDMVEDYINRELVHRQSPAGVPKLAACVADTYDVYAFVEYVTTGRIKDLVKSSGGTLVIRPDSGDPLKVIPTILSICERNLDVYTNSKGYKVLPYYYRLIQGDGIDIHTIQAILAQLRVLGWSASNIAFGSGGGLLQKLNRDTQKWKYAFSSCTVDGVQRDVAKDPVTDPGKKSVPGRLDVIRTDDGSFKTVELTDNAIEHSGSVMNTVYEDGDILWTTTLSEVRANMDLTNT